MPGTAAPAGPRPRRQHQGDKPGGRRACGGDPAVRTTMIGDEGWSHEGGNRLRRACLRGWRSRDAWRRTHCAHPRRDRAFGRRRGPARTVRCAARRHGARRHRRAFPRQRSALEGRRQPALPAALRGARAGAGLARRQRRPDDPRAGAAHRASPSARCGRISRTTSACGIDCINVKATTTEGLGALGRGEGLACQAIVLLAHGDDAHQNGHDGH